MSNMGLEAALKRSNIQMLRAPVGDKYVLEQMLSTGAALGGEQSGHIIFSGRSTTGDVVYVDAGFRMMGLPEEAPAQGGPA